MQNVFQYGTYMELVYVTVLGGPLNRPAYIVGGNCWNYTQVTVGSSPIVSEKPAVV